MQNPCDASILGIIYALLPIEYACHPIVKGSLLHNKWWKDVIIQALSVNASQWGASVPQGIKGTQSYVSLVQTGTQYHNQEEEEPQTVGQGEDLGKSLTRELRYNSWQKANGMKVDNCILFNHILYTWINLISRIKVESL